MNVFFPQKFLLILLFLLVLVFNSYAQPSNDACSNAISITLAANEATCVPVMGDTRNTEDATTVPGPAVCSGSWYTDDVWYAFNTGAVVPTSGILVKANFTGTGDDISAVGIAIYASCDVSETTISCFSSDDPTENSTLIPPQCLAPNTDYLVRVWSGVSPSDNAGTFTICAFAADPLPPSTDVVIWSENFDAGIGDWSSNVIEGDSLDGWMWDATGTFFDAFGGTVNLESFTGSCNGAMGFPAGWYQTGRTGDPMNISPGPPYRQHSAELISPPIDCSNFSAATCKVTSAFRGLNGNGQISNLGSSFSYSLDGGETWSAAINPAAELEVGIAYNDLEQRFNLSGAGGVADVRIRFTFTGDFYYWILDDILLVEPEANNMRVNPFFAIPTNAIIPAAQVEPIYFMTDIENIGSQAQTNVNLNLTITDAVGNEVYSDDYSYGTVEAGTDVQNQPMENAFTPPAEPGVYTGTYTISADNADFDDSDNSQSFSFEVSENIFAKENGATRGATPIPTSWDDGAPHSWAMGNSFHVEIGPSSGVENMAYACESVSFGIDNPADLVGQVLTIWLYKWNNDDNDDMVQESEREPIAFNQYVIDGTEGEGPFTVVMPLIDFATGDGSEPIWLEDDANYIVMVEYTAPDDQTDLSLRASEAVFNYEAQIFMNLSTDALGLGVGEARFSPVLGLPEDGDFSSGVDYNTVGFGRNFVATIRMNAPLVLKISTQELSDENVLQVYPNPTQDRVNLYLDLVDIAADANVTIVDITGKTVFGQDYQNIKNNTLTFDVSNYANGTYYLYLTTNTGTKVKKFVVQK